MTNSLAAEISAQEDRRYAAMIAKDVAALEELLAEELVYTHSTGLVDSKRSYIDAIAARRFDYRGAKRLEENVVDHGDAALVTGQVEIEAVAGGQTINLNARFTVLYVRQDGSWRFAAWQSTPLLAA